MDRSIATLTNLNEAISTATGADAGQVKVLSRKLREAGLIPQKGRGLHAAHLEASHVATLLVGLLVAGQGRLHTVASIVRQIGTLRKKNALEIRPYSDSPECVELLPPDTTFIDALSAVISAFSQNETPASFHGAVNCIGIHFGAGRAYPWIEFKRDQREFNGLTSEQDRLCAFGSASLLHRVQTEGMVSEAKISNGVLLEIAQLLRKDANSIAVYIEHLKKKHIRKN